MQRRPDIRILYVWHMQTTSRNAQLFRTYKRKASRNYIHPPVLKFGRLNNDPRGALYPIELKTIYPHDEGLNASSTNYENWVVSNRLIPPVCEIHSLLRGVFRTHPMRLMGDYSIFQMMHIWR